MPSLRFSGWAEPEGSLMDQVAVMGSSGSIGRQCLDVIRDSNGRFGVSALVARRSAVEIARQAAEFNVKRVGLLDFEAAAEARELLGPGVEVVAGDSAFELLEGADIVVNGVIGFAGLRVTMGAIAQGARIGLANKESLVAAGDLVEAALLSHPEAEMIPVDSEHSAIFQCLGFTRRPGASLFGLVLTASGGPFRTRSLADLDSVTVEEALIHPNWSMGAKITVDSSTLFNKGLEVIEAHYLFGVGYDSIQVVVHPEQVVHSMVSFSDGTSIAQLSEPTMRLPIAVALYYPERSEVAYGPMNWAKPLALNFEPVDHRRFPAVGLAFEAGTLAGGAPCWFNAANEVAVAAFLEGGIRWRQIYEVVAASMEAYPGSGLESAEHVVELDREARAVAAKVVGSIG